MAPIPENLNLYFQFVFPIYYDLFLWSRCKQTSGSPDGKQWPLPIDICNVERLANSLLVSEVEIYGRKSRKREAEAEKGR